MIEEAFILLCEIILASIAGIGIVIILAASWYDFRAITTRSRIQQTIKKLRQPQQPHIAILVYAHNNAATIKHCLDSIHHSRYKRYSVTIINNRSTDNTSKIMQQYKKRHSKALLRIITKRKFIERTRLIRMSHSKAHVNDLLLVINAGTIITPTLLKECAAHFVNNPSLEGLRLRRSLSQDVTISTLVDHTLALSANIYHKASSFFSTRHYQFATANIMTRSAVIRRNKITQPLQTHYASSCVVQSVVPAVTIPRSKTSFFIILLLLTMMTYFFYTAASLQSNTFLILSWLIASLWITASVWSDEKLQLFKKIGLSFCVPVIYFVGYIYLLMHLYSSVKHLHSKAAFYVNTNVPIRTKQA